MNILHVEVGRHHYGGAAQVDLLMHDLRGRGVRNILLCSQDAPIADTDAAAVVIAKPIAGDVDLRLLFWVWQAIRRYDIDVVHVHSRRGADVWGGIAARLARTPAIITRRVDNPETAWLARCKYALYKYVAVISTAVEAEINRVGVNPDKIVRVPSTVNPAVFHPRPENPALRAEFGVPPGGLCVGMVAQLIPRKGHQDLLAALSQLVETMPSVHVVLCGQGPLRPQLEREVQQAGLASNVCFAGFRDDMETVMAAFDVVVHPAHREGLGVAVLQASACGIPVIAARAGGLVDVVVDGETGLLVPPGDPGALADALGRLAGDRVERTRMGEHALDKVHEEFAPQTMGAAYRALYLRH